MMGDVVATRMALTNASQLSQLDEEYKSAKIVYKRRSSVFRRQSVTCNRQESDNEVTTNRAGLASSKNEGNTQTDNTQDDNTQADAETFNLEEYIERLKQERKDWLEEYRKRRTQRKNLTKQKAIMENQGQSLDINMLTESERAFIIARPNYEYICKNSQKVSDVVLKISVLSQIVHKLNQRFMEKMENNISKATQDIIEMSKQ